ncbi:MAG: sugar transferase [Pirellulaceae bacterium]|nr:sugar transferase [Pirellulaceae bacterium]
MLLNQRQLQRVLAKERLRADREESCFGLIILRVVDLRNVRGTSLKLAKLLHRRLRETDEKGHLNYGRIGVVLPATGEVGTQLVLADILRLAAEAKLPIEGEAFVYPERPRRFDDKSNDSSMDDTVEVLSDQTASDSFQPQPSDSIKVAALPTAMLVSAYPTWKRLVDILGASFGLLISLPFILLAAAIIRLTSPGPAFFAQRRIGYLGRPFWIFKLRTMIANAELLQEELLERNERDGPAFKMRHDPRITRVGRILRSTGLDELPQLFNVFIGDMSLVGPRPLPVSEAEQCEPWQRARMHTKPGLTCFWQLAKSRKMSFVEWMRLDMRYARARNLWLDLKLIVNTFTAVVLGRVGH